MADRKGYARLSNGFYANTKVRKLMRRNPCAIAVYVCAISYCSDRLTDGLISEDDLMFQCDAEMQDIDDLVACGMLDAMDDGAYRIHDYLVHQSSREQVENTAERERNKKRRQREARDNSDVPPVSPECPADVPDVSRGDNSNVPTMSPGDNSDVPPVSPECPADVPDVSRGDNSNVPTMSPGDNSDVPPVSPRDCLTKNQEPITNNQESNILPQTPSVEGAGEEEQETEAIRENTADHAISFEQAQEIVRRVREFYPAVKFRGRSYEPGIILQSDAILRVAGQQPDIVDWFVDRCRAYVEHQSEPRYVTEFATYVRGGGPSGKRPYWEIDWASEPMPPDPKAEAEAKRHERNMSDVDYLCRNWRDEECQLAALELPEKAQALARARYPDEWYKLWRRGTKLKEREKQATKTPKDTHPSTSTGVP
ncbi:hypothetical protein [Bifidobacterium vansinderenii]|uniref:Uncharacterized protein n=1 Tax=Bifidobacterium vansinderenii TaxID=1984871 RepID=A0A229VWJ6_9BIFI|nr:hypothetical protein [Bifidobacterium vansinderenii]OXM99905.1 hypothetical protein Tam10B_1868 [Bifidobacterium vansinderenii]